MLKPTRTREVHPIRSVLVTWRTIAMRGGLLLASWSGLAGCQTNASTEDVLLDGPVLLRVADHRAPKKAEVETPLPPIQGGSLLVTSDGVHAIVGDIDRHRIVGVSLDRGEVSFTLPLKDAALPGRMVEGVDGRVHVVMRGLGQLWTLSPADGSVSRHIDVCREPRGIAYGSQDQQLHVACADGTLWSYADDTGETVRKLHVATDLRDVISDGGDGLWVSTFRSARVFHVDGAGAVTRVPELPGAVKFDQAFGDMATLAAGGAFRMVSDRAGGAVLVHQRSQTTDVVVDPHAKPSNEITGEDLFESIDFEGAGGSSYGGGAGGIAPFGDCGAIVQTAVTHLSVDGERSASDALPEAVLGVDVAFDGDTAAVALAGLRDPAAPKSTLLLSEDASLMDADCEDCSGSVQLIATGDLSVGDHASCAQSMVVPIPEPAISVAFMPDGQRLLVQVREPSRLYVVGASTGIPQGRIELEGVSVTDTGHDLFHRDSGGGIACASCHLEGAEDGHTWFFTGLGPRRTQPLNVGIEGTQPFHWDGVMQGLGAIMNEVFVGRMGGAPQSPERVDALEQWVGTLTPPGAVRDAEDPAAVRGKRLFESEAVGCSGCHVGKKLTNNQTVDVGTSDGVPLQVPSLLGVALRTPLMHDGCARTLYERFDAGACGGGDKHGHTLQLTDAEIDDLVAYLETL